MTTEKREIRITGFGGQGVILAGFILGQAASRFDNQHCVFTQSYGPEARGSACSASIIISPSRIQYPFIKQHDILVAMSQEGFDKYTPKTSDNGIIIIDRDLVEINDISFPKSNLIPIEATKMAEKELGKRIFTNIIMLGFLTAYCGVVTKEALEKSVSSAVPEGMRDLNLKALAMGMQYHFKPPNFNRGIDE